jgi:phosphoribosylaminoimidazole (AIR) synthetase
MGVGMVVMTDEAGAVAVEAGASSANVDAWRLGRAVRGTGQVHIT